MVGQLVEELGNHRIVAVNCSNRVVNDEYILLYDAYCAMFARLYEKHDSKNGESGNDDRKTKRGRCGAGPQRDQP